jgi:hypothetical protein
VYSQRRVNLPAPPALARTPRHIGSVARVTTTNTTVSTVFLGLLVGALLWTSLAPAQSMYRCVGADNRVTYQQRPCAGTGASIDVRPASGTTVEASQSEGTGKSAAAPPKVAPLPPTSTATPLPDLPDVPPPQARGRLDGWPKSGEGLVKGMQPGAVIQRWGRPHQVEIVGEHGLFFDYCDSRIAFFWRGALSSWAAIFPDSKAGAYLYSYGQPWAIASQKWGFEREQKAYSNSVSDRGNVQTWAKSRWIVTDAQGNIVSWCDAAPPGSAMAPPTRRTPWE